MMPPTMGDKITPPIPLCSSAARTLLACSCFAPCAKARKVGFDSSGVGTDFAELACLTGETSARLAGGEKLSARLRLLRFFFAGLFRPLLVGGLGDEESDVSGSESACLLL